MKVQNFKKYFLLWSWSFLAILPVASLAGTKDSGGDPMAQQFIDLGEKLSIYFEYNPLRQTLLFKVSEFTALVERIAHSVEDENTPDLVEFTSDRLYDKDGIEKPAVFNLETSRIRLNRDAWQEASPETRLIQVTLELTGLLQQKVLRYETAERLIAGQANVILAIPSQRGAKPPATHGWRLVGEVYEQFAALTSFATLIDGGVLTSGSDQVKKALRFLQNPTENMEWLNLIIDTWTGQKRPAYFIVHGPDGSYAMVTSFYYAKNAYHQGMLDVKAYSHYFVKDRQIYEGPCVGEAKSLSTLERLHKCYLNKNIYRVQEHVASLPVASTASAEEFLQVFFEVTKELRQQYEYLFAQENEIKLEALRNNFITDYSRTMVNGDDAAAVLNASLRANGLTVDLEGPVSASLFWKSTGVRDFAAWRLYSAVKTLAQNGLVYINQLYTCDKDGVEIKGPLVLAKAEFASLQAQKKCTWHPKIVPLQEDLFMALRKSGFYYDRKREDWVSSAGVKK